MKGVETMSELSEMVMLVCFGFSWPMNVIKSCRTKSAKGKSLSFLCLILLGYVAGITAKLTNVAYMRELTERWYILAAYLLNFTMVGVDLCLYCRNRRLDKEREKTA